MAGFAPDGKLAGRASLAHAGLTVGDDFLIATLDEALVVLSKRDLTEVGRVAGKFEKVLVEGALGRGRAAAFHYDGQSVGRVILLRLGK